MAKKNPVGLCSGGFRVSQMGWDVGLWDSCGEIFSQIFTLLELE